jgi:hypothetical protein
MELENGSARSIIIRLLLLGCASAKWTLGLRINHKLRSEIEIVEFCFQA